MTTAKHTQGPWTQGGCDTANPSHVFVSAKDGQVDIYDAPHTGETMANARLIAASPDLLSACESLVAGVEDSVLRFLASHELRLRADMEIVLVARLERARTAIAKARGVK